jgi:surface antigen
MEMYEAAHPGSSWEPARGNGWELAANNGGSASTPPSLGAMASYGTAKDYGHVMIVEEIVRSPDGGVRFRVSEMNVDRNADVGLPQEYTDTRWWKQGPGGTWVRESDGKSVSMTFAKFPG